MKCVNLFTFLTLVTALASAQEVLNVKDKKVLMDFHESTLVPKNDDEVYLLDNGKKVGIVKVTTTKGTRALGILTKGRANPGMQVESKSSGSKSDSTLPKHQPESWAVLGSINLQTMNAQVTGSGATATSNMTGTTFSLGAAYNIPFNREIVFEGDVLWENYSLTGTISYPPGCTASTNCNVSINYLSGYGLAKYYFLTSKIRAYAMAGIGFMQPISKSSNILDSNAIAFTQCFPFGGGIDWQLSRKNYIPIRVQYNYFVSSATVASSAISITGGFAWNF